MEKISDKNLICIILTVGLAFLTIGNAFHAGNWVLGMETLFMWAVLYSFQPLSKVIDTKLVCPYAKIDILPYIKQTVDNRYLFVSFCFALLFTMVFDDTLNYTGRFLEDKEFLDMLAVCGVFFLSAVITYSFYYLVSKIKIEKFIAKGAKSEAQVEKVKFLNNRCYVSVKVVNPLTEKKQRIVAQVFSGAAKKVGAKVFVYFDRKKPSEYYLDMYFAG